MSLYSRRRRMWALGALLCALGWALTSGISPAQATTQTFNYTGGEQIFVVPSGVTKLNVRLIGAEGGSVGGLGAQVDADLDVIPGQTLYVEVGGAGEDSGAGSAGGFNGGAAGGGGAGGGGGGGGAADIRLAPLSLGLSTDTRLVVAAGGGGGAGDGESSAGGAGGDAGEGGETSEGGNEGGGAGTSSAGGGGGSGCSLSGTSGELGVGGAGGAGFSTNSGGGGGGGGCGAGGGGGGGGSSLVPAGGTLGLAPEGVASTVAITYTLPTVTPPAANPPATSAPPNTVLGFHPPKKVKTAKAKAKVKFTFSSNVAGVTFKCKLDKAAFAPCTSPKTYKVKPGKHKFSVEAISGGLTDSSPATFSFKVTKTS